MVSCNKISLSEVSISPKKIAELQAANAGKKKAKKRRGAKALSFIYRIPLDWAEQACGLRGKCANLVLAIWFAAGVERGRSFKLTCKWYGGFDIGEKALRDGLTRLSNAGLISVEYGPGRAPFVTVLDAPKGSGDE
jgi:hypothetical protein